MKRLAAALLATVATFAVLAPIRANAVATQTTAALSSTSWTDLGAGPMRLYGSGHTRYAISDSTPATVTLGFEIGEGPTDVNTTSHVWVISADRSYNAFATYAPITAGGSGGGGGAATIADGADVAEGTTTDTSSANTLVGLLKAVKTNTAAGVGNASVGAVGATAPTSITLMGSQDGSGNAQAASAANPVPVTSTVVQANTSAPISISTATTTQLVALSSGKLIYVTAWDAIANGTTNFTLEYGSGAACATGTTTLTGAYGLVAQFGVAKGSGLGPVLVVPAGKALCAVTSAAVQVSGSVAYVQQ